MMRLSRASFVLRLGTSKSVSQRNDLDLYCGLPTKEIKILKRLIVFLSSGRFQCESKKLFIISTYLHFSEVKNSGTIELPPLKLPNEVGHFDNVFVFEKNLDVTALEYEMQC